MDFSMIICLINDTATFFLTPAMCIDLLALSVLSFVFPVLLHP